MNVAIAPFKFELAVRQRVSLVIMLAGPSGSGKTFSSLALARGLAGGNDNKIAVIDTESGRALHYAPAPGESRNGNKFAFQHGALHAPFTPEAYIAAIKTADDAGFEVIVIDSCTHEWEGEGGLQDMHTALVEAAVAKSREDAAAKGWSFNEAASADRASIGAWKEPKMRHKRFVSRLLQCRAHLILCFRADEKMRMETVEEKGSNGKTYKRTVITQPKDLPPGERWVPICERRMPYEMTLSCILTPDRPGFPIPIKLQAQHRHAVPEDTLLSEETGRALAEWARGGAVAQTSAGPNAALTAEGHAAAARGMTAFRAYWERIKQQRPSVGGVPQRDAWIAIAKTADSRASAGADADDIPDDEPAATTAHEASANGPKVSPQGTEGAAPRQGQPDGAGVGPQPAPASDDDMFPGDKPSKLPPADKPSASDTAETAWQRGAEARRRGMGRRAAVPGEYRAKGAEALARACEEGWDAEGTPDATEARRHG